jgi:hypothetical protein
MTLVDKAREWQASYMRSWIKLEHLIHIHMAEQKEVSEMVILEYVNHLTGAVLRDKILGTQEVISHIENPSLPDFKIGTIIGEQTTLLQCQYKNQQRFNITIEIC